MTTSRQALGSWGERLAASYLEERGYTILARNARTPYGEIDLVARQAACQGTGLNTVKGNIKVGSFGTTEGEPPGVGHSDAENLGTMLVFVEVKTRSSTSFGSPEAAIDRRKMEHMLASAQAYVQAHPELEDDWRIDVIAVQRYRSGGEPQITHFENAIT